MEIKPLKINYKNFYYPPGGILMWIIIFLELFTFGMALVALAFSSRDNPQLFHESSLHLNRTFGTINTIFLLASGFFVANAVHNYKENNFNKASFTLKSSFVFNFVINQDSILLSSSSAVNGFSLLCKKV